MLPASNFPLSRHKMYCSLRESLSNVSGNALFVGETGNSGIIDILNKNCDITVTDFPQVDIMNMCQVDDNQYDIVVADQVLEHITTPQQAIDEMKRVTKPGGYVVVTSCLMNPIHYSSNQAQDDYWRFTPSGLKHLCRDFEEICLCEGSGDFKLLFYCTNDLRHKKDIPEFDNVAYGDDGRTYIHVYIVARK